MRRARTGLATAGLLGALLIALAGCRRAEPRAGAREGESTAVRPTGATATAPGEVGPAAIDTSLIPPGSPDSTGRFGAPGYGFKRGGRF